MKLSTRTRYGIRAMLELAENKMDSPLQLKIIAEHQDISVKYLEQLMAILKSAGFVRSIRGSRGGYVLARAPNQIRVGDIFKCLEGSVVTAECVENEDYCDRAADCVAKELWTRVEAAIRNVLQSITVQDLVDWAEEKRGLDYQI